MKKAIPYLFFLLLYPFNHLKSQEIQALLDSGKLEFKRQDSDTFHQFDKAAILLEKAIKLDPKNAEARYFLGYTIDRMNSFDGSRMHGITTKMAIRASEQFEMVNKIQPHYKGEYYGLDPYSKIAAIWGSLAMAFQVKNQNDSAKWAFLEGKQKGGFNEALLEYNRQLLASCKQNSILITYGDNNSIPIWYLQKIENLRNDIIPVDANLINTSWYMHYLKNIKKLKISLTDLQIDTSGYLLWSDTDISIKNSKDSQQVFNWTLKPTYFGNYILKGDIMLLNILDQNLFERPIYFPAFSDSTYNLFLDSLLVGDGLVSRLTIKKLDPSIDFTGNLKLYKLNITTASEILKSKNTIELLNGYRWTYYNNAYYLYTRGNKRKAKILLEEMDKKFHPETLPYLSEMFENAIIDLKRKLEK
jgi:hypothetical protein